MSVHFDTGTDTLRGAGPAIGTAEWSHGFSLYIESAAASGQLFALCSDFASPTGAFLSLEAGGSGLVLYSGTGNTGTPFAFAAQTWYYLVIGRTGDNVIFRAFSASSTPDFTSASADGSGANYTLTNRGYGAASGFNGNAPDFKVESEKWELGVYWSDAECWAEAQKYALQREEGTPEITCYLSNTDADSEGVTDISGTPQSLTNSGCADTLATRPSYLEALGGTLVATDDGYQLRQMGGWDGIVTVFG